MFQPLGILFIIKFFTRVSIFTKIICAVVFRTHSNINYDVVFLQK